MTELPYFRQNKLRAEVPSTARRKSTYIAEPRPLRLLEMFRRASADARLDPPSGGFYMRGVGE